MASIPKHNAPPSSGKAVRAPFRSFLLLCLIFLLGCQTPKDGWPKDFSEADKLSLVAFIKTQTDEPIWIIRHDEEAPELIKVMTGHELKAFASSGYSFLLKKTKTGWQIVRRDR